MALALTEEQGRVLGIALADGVVFSGACVRDGGRGKDVAASTLRALERRGLLALRVGPDGGIMGSPTAAAKERA